MKILNNELEEELDESYPESVEDLNKEIQITFNNYNIIFGKIKNNLLYFDLMKYHNCRIRYLC